MFKQQLLKSPYPTPEHTLKRREGSNTKESTSIVVQQQ